MSPLRYVILWHDGVAEPHFDLMFETLPGSALATWRSAAWPIEQPVSLTRLKDHRRDYLEFEGDLTQRRGRVTRVTAGTCRVDIAQDAVWTIHFLSGTPPLALVLSRSDDPNWVATPA